MITSPSHTIPDWLAQQVTRQPDGIALVTHRGTENELLTWRELDERAALAASRFAAAGIRYGQRVGILLYSQPQEVVQIFALLRLGAVLVPLNTRLTPAEIHFQMEQTEAAHLICPTAEQAAPYRGGTWSIIIPDERAASPFPYPVIAHDNTPLAIIHTSGTSGKPKGAVLTHGGILAGAIANEKRIPLSPADRWLCVLPLYHVGGLSLLFRAAHSGFTVDLYPRFEAATIDRALCSGAFTLLSLVPTMLYRLLREGNPAQWRDLRFVLLGGAAASPELLALARGHQVRVATTYGMTEAGSQVATALPDLAERKPGTVGKPLDGVQVRVVDEAGNAVTAGEYGEILVQGPILMQGYFNQPAATARSLRDGWYHSGDIGYRDSDGDLFLVQRRSDLIVTGGENVYPAEVEAALRQHPAVEDCAVVGLPDPEWGQRVAAAIVLKTGISADETALQTHVRSLLAGYKVPRLIRFFAALPLTASGKIERHRVQALLTSP